MDDRSSAGPLQVLWAQRRKRLYLSFLASAASDVVTVVDADSNKLSFSCVTGGVPVSIALHLSGAVSIASRRVHEKLVRLELTKRDPSDWDRLTRDPPRSVKGFISYDWDLDNTLPDDEEGGSSGNDSDDEEPKQKTSKPKNVSSCVDRNPHPEESSATPSTVKEPAATSKGDDQRQELERKQKRYDALRRRLDLYTAKEVAVLVMVAVFLSCVTTYVLCSWGILM